MTAPDVIQQAREALAAWDQGEPWQGHEPEWILALRAVVEAADGGHLIDARRIEALGSVDLSHDSGDERRPSRWKVTQFSDPGAVGIGKTAADALAAAEREAAQ